MEYTAAVLRNKGVQVETAVLVTRDEDGGLPSRAKDGHGDFKTDSRWIRFDANSIADMEEVFGSLAKFEETSRETPFNAIRKALAIVWECSPREAGLMMLDGKIGDYSTAVGVALSIANGVDPTQAARLLKVGVSATTKLTKEREKALEEALQEAEAEERRQELALVEGSKEDEESESPSDSTLTEPSPGDDSSDSGSEPDEATTSSGDTAPDRSPTPSSPGSEPKPPSGAEEKATGTNGRTDRLTTVPAAGRTSS